MTALAKIEYTPDQVGLIKRSVAKNCTDDELKLFLHLSQKYDLDPFAKEIWCIKRNPNDAALIMTARDGYLKIANISPQFDGMTSGVVRVGDAFFRTPDGGVSHTFGDKRGDIIGAFALVKRKDRHIDSFAWAEYSEYKQSNPVWNKYPSAMIMKVAESMALKRAFSISGLVTQEEMGEQIPSQIPITEDIEAIEIKKDKGRTDDIMEALERGNAQERQDTAPAPSAPQEPANPDVPFIPSNGQQLAVVQSLMSNPAFTPEEREAFLKKAKEASKEKCDQLITRIRNEWQKRINKPQNATAPRV